MNDTLRLFLSNGDPIHITRVNNDDGETIFIFGGKNGATIGHDLYFLINELFEKYGTEEKRKLSDFALKGRIDE